MSSTRIKGIEIYHPDNIVNYKYFVDKYKKDYGKDIERLLLACGKQDRYLIKKEDVDENSLTMAIKAAKKVLENCNLSGEEINMLVYSTQTPEYNCPPNSAIIATEISLNSGAIIFDQNVNCTGMLIGLMTIDAMMKSNPNIKRALLIGSDNFSAICNEDNEYTYPMTADAACAVILERTDENDVGVLDYQEINYLNKNDPPYNYVRFPKNGLKKSFDDTAYDRRTYWPNGLNVKVLPEIIKKSHSLIESRSGISVKDIDTFIPSQYTPGIIKKVMQVLDADAEKAVYYGDKCGYTGTSSPFVALYYALKEGKIKRGDLLSFWTYGLHWTTGTLIMRF